MVDDPDAIWKPGYEGPVSTVEFDTDDLHDPSLEPPPAPPARSRWWFAVGGVLLVALVGVVVALDPLGVGGDPDQDVASDGTVVGGPDDRRLPQTVAELWSADIDVGDDVSDHWVEVIRRDLVVAAVGDRSGTGAALVAFDALTGEQRWTFPFDARPSDVVVVGAAGDVLVIEQAGAPSATVISIDMATGERRPAEDGSPNADDGGAFDALSVDSRMPVTGSSFVTTAPGSIAGVVVDGDTERVVWSRSDGAVVDQHPIDGGTLIQVATRGGAGMELVDGSTGETLENLAMVPGALQALVVARDGIVVMRPAAIGVRLVAIDFDGTERWAMLGSEPLVVGDRVVARATSLDGQLRISAYGDID